MIGTAGGAGPVFGPSRLTAGDGERIAARSLRVQLFETATGALLQSWDVAPEAIYDVNSRARFSPDGKRVLLRYRSRAQWAPETGRMVVRESSKDRLWVARTDGTVEHDISVHERPSDAGRASGGRIEWYDTNLNTCSPDDRHVALSGVGVVEIWDLETGTRKHRLAGHTGTSRNIAAAYNADGTRLFTRDAGEGGPFAARAAGLQIHVWDTTTGRELLTLAGGAGLFLPGGTDALKLVGQQLHSRSAFNTYILDGTPVKP